MNAGAIIVLVVVAIGYLVYRKIGFGQGDVPSCHSEHGGCSECGATGG